MSRKDRPGSSGEAIASDPGDSDFLTYEEVTLYQQRSNESPRLLALIGMTFRFSDGTVYLVPYNSLSLSFFFFN